MRVKARPLLRKRRAAAALNGFPAWLLAVVVASTTFAASAASPEGLQPGASREFQVELPTGLRELAGSGNLSSVAHARVTIAVPAAFDAARDWPVLIVSATSDPQYHSSRALAADYAESALGAGWVVLAADPAEEVSALYDTVKLRYALNLAALGVLKLEWPRSERAPLAFGGFSGGAKYSGLLAAVFASQGRTIAGIYLAGINEDMVAQPAAQANLLSESYRRVPIFLQSGETDEVATPADHVRVYDALKQAGFQNIRIEHFAGGHVLYPPGLRTALDWFRETAIAPATGR